jgi:sporulation protein YlmC with PRC-barrel domain
MQVYLSQVVGRPVLDRHGEPIGKVADLIVAIGDRYPPVTGLVVKTDRRRIFLPWADVASFDARGAQLGTATIESDTFQQRDNELLLFADLQDKQIIASTAARSSGSTTCASTRSRASSTLWRSTSVLPGCFAGWASKARIGRSRATFACRSPSATSTGRMWTPSRPPSPRSACACPASLTGCILRSGLDHRPARSS